MITIYGRKNSSNVQLVMWAINELGVPHERLDYGMGHASAQSEDFRKMNPMGQVPVLKEGATTVFESAAILRYLGARHGNDIFWPSDPLRRAALDQWAEWGKNVFAPAVLRVFFLTVRFKPENQDADAIAKAVDATVPLVKILDERIGDGPWLDGNNFTFADIACGHILHRYYTMDFERVDAPSLAAYFERLQTRAAYRDHAMISYDALRAVD